MAISVPQVDRELLDRLLRFFGGSIYLRSTNRRPIHTWELTGPTAVGVMMTLYPMMSLKRKREIRTAIDEWRTRPGTGIRNREKTHCPRGHPYDTILPLKKLKANGQPKTHRRCSICYKAWWAKNGSRYYERSNRQRRERHLRAVP